MRPAYYIGSGRHICGRRQTFSSMARLFFSVPRAKMRSGSVMWPCRLLPVFTLLSLLRFLCAPGVTPKVARAISAVRMLYSLPLTTQGKILDAALHKERVRNNFPICLAADGRIAALPLVCVARYTALGAPCTASRLPPPNREVIPYMLLSWLPHLMSSEPEPQVGSQMRSPGCGSISSAMSSDTSGEVYIRRLFCRHRR